MSRINKEEAIAAVGAETIEKLLCERVDFTNRVIGDGTWVEFSARLR